MAPKMIFLLFALMPLHKQKRHNVHIFRRAVFFFLFYCAEPSRSDAARLAAAEFKLNMATPSAEVGFAQNVTFQLCLLLEAGNQNERRRNGHNIIIIN